MWSDPSSILSLLNSQKDVISAELPPEVSKALGASGLLAGLGGAAAAATRTAASTVSSAATAASSTVSSAARSIPTPPPPPAPTPASSGFPMWAIILIVIVVLLAIWWFMTQNQKPAEPAKTGLLNSPVEYVLGALPAPELMND